MKKLIAILVFSLSFGAMGQTQPKQYIKPCMVQVAPTTWLNMNDLFSLSWTPDGTTVVVQFKDGKELRFVIPADQARNYVTRALSTFEACRR